MFILVYFYMYLNENAYVNVKPDMLYDKLSVSLVELAL